MNNVRYADDIVVMTSSPVRFLEQSNMSVASWVFWSVKWRQKWRLLMHKTTCCKRRRRTARKIDRFTYLGAIVMEDGNRETDL